MPKLTWDGTGERRYETGVDHGVLYIPNQLGVYAAGFPWNGLTSISESPSGAEASPQYADNIKYLNLMSAEDFGATVEAFTYPLEFAQCDGSAAPTPGVSIGQQTRKSFGLSYRTKVGNDQEGTDFGYKLHLIYNALAAPTEKAYSTINDSPEAMALSWELTTTPVEVPGFKPSAQMTIDSTQVDPGKLKDLEDILYGTDSASARLPMPAEVIALFAGSALVEVKPAKPTQASNNVTIPVVTGVSYTVDGETVTGVLAITEDTFVTAWPTEGYKFPAVTDNDWLFEFA